MGYLRRSTWAIAAVAAAICLAAPAHAQKTLRVVMHSDLKILDPIWTTAYIVRNHGYMIYDTLFAQDDKGEIKPQMVDKYEVSADKLTYTFTLRDGLAWHDGPPVTAEDCVASIKRWAAKDAIGQKMMSFVAGIDAVNDQDLHHQAQGADRPRADRPRQAVLERALHDAQARRRDRSQHADLRLHRLGSLRLQARRVEARRQDRLRQEREVQAALGAGLRPRRRQGGQGRPRRVAGHLATTSRRSTRCSPARSTTSRRPSTTCCRCSRATPTSSCGTTTRSATSTPSAPTSCTSRSTIRRCARRCGTPSTRRTFSTASSAIPTTTRSARRCSCAARRSPRTRAWTACSKSNFTKAQALLKEAGYDGTPIVLMHSTDLDVLTNLAPVAKIADGEGRLQGRHAVDGLADGGRAPRQEGPGQRRRLARVPDLLGGGRHHQSRHGRLPQFGVRQGAVRLALRRGDGEAARPVRARDRSGQAEGDRRGRAGARHAR